MLISPTPLMSVVMPETRAGRAFVVVVTLSTLAATLLAWLDLRQRSTALTAKVTDAIGAQERLERAVQLFRFERGSKGLGVTALIEQLRFWAPLLDLSTTPQREIAPIQERVDDILSALDDIGKDAFGPLHGEFKKSEPGKDDELIRWLLLAMSRVDAERGKDLLAACLRGFEVPVTSRIRVIAAERLLELDRARTASILAEILAYESSSGIDSTRMSVEMQAKYAAAKIQPPPMRMLFNLVDILVKSSAPNLEDHLIMVASRQGQDRMTVQACVRYLGELKAPRAVRVIKKLFDTPPELIINPIFQNHCLDAIAQIEGGGACDYFRELLRAKPDERVQAKLQQLIKTHCR